jgi:release factor glutamine methyltransferase
LLQADGLPLVDGLLDVVVSNPPYVTDEEYAGLEASVQGHEPRLALTGSLPNPDGLLFYVRLATEARAVLNPGGLLALEIGAAQGPAVRDILLSNGWENVQILPDMAGRDRVVTALRAAV